MDVPCFILSLLSAALLGWRMDAFNAPPADLQCADMRDDRCAKFAASSGSANIGFAIGSGTCWPSLSHRRKRRRALCRDGMCWAGWPLALLEKGRVTPHRRGLRDASRGDVVGADT